MRRSNPKETKVVLLGSSGVGKTSFALRFCSNTFKQELSTTLGAAFSSKSILVQNREVKFQIWDTAGQEKYRSLLSLYYRDAQIAILIFDVEHECTLQQLKWWVDQLVDNGPRNITKVIVCNKMDLCVDRKGLEERAMEFAKSLGCQLFFSSCKDAEGVDDVFQHLGEEMVQLWDRREKEKIGKSYIDQSYVEEDYKKSNLGSEVQQKRTNDKCC